MPMYGDGIYVQNTHAALPMESHHLQRQTKQTKLCYEIILQRTYEEGFTNEKGNYYQFSIQLL